MAQDTAGPLELGLRDVLIGMVGQERVAGPNSAAGTPCSQKEATSVHPTLARGAVAVSATSAARSGWPKEGGAPSAPSISSQLSPSSSLKEPLSS